MKSGAFWAGILGGLILAVVVGFAVLPMIGVFNMTATGGNNILDWWGHTNLESTLKRKAPKATLPADIDTNEGFEHYRSTCLHCHGAPDVPRAKWANYMLPLPPQLWSEDVMKAPDGELFYIVSNGIRMSGMPAFGQYHAEKDIWNIVAMVRQLNKLTDTQKQQLQETAATFSHGGTDHHHAEGQ